MAGKSKPRDGRRRTSGATTTSTARTRCAPLLHQGVLSDWSKTEGSTRRVPLRQRVVASLVALPSRHAGRLVFPAPRGGYLDLHNWRAREWHPAQRAAGIDLPRRIYDLRHTYATWSIAAGVNLFV